jgi:hypothetical protein
MFSIPPTRNETYVMVGDAQHPPEKESLASLKVFAG